MSHVGGTRLIPSLLLYHARAMCFPCLPLLLIVSCAPLTLTRVSVHSLHCAHPTFHCHSQCQVCMLHGSCIKMCPCCAYVAVNTSGVCVCVSVNTSGVCVSVSTLCHPQHHRNGCATMDSLTTELPVLPSHSEQHAHECRCIDCDVRSKLCRLHIAHLILRGVLRMA